MSTMDADEIVASGRSSLFGSVGVMNTLAKWYRKPYNESYTELYADTSQDKNADWRAWLANASTELYKARLNEFDKIFMEDLKRARSLARSLQSSTLAGGTWLAEDAIRRGLCDSIGDYNFAYQRVAMATANYSA